MLGQLDARVQGELLQVHERDAALPRGRVARRAGLALALRVQGHDAPAAATSSRSRATRSMLVDDGSSRGQLPRDAAPRRAARHRRPHAPRRQAQGAPRSRRRVLHDRRGHQGQAREGVGPRRSPGRRARSGTRRSTRAREGARRRSSKSRAARRSSCRRSSRRSRADRLALQATSSSTLDAAAPHRRRSSCAAPTPRRPDDARDGRQRAVGAAGVPRARRRAASTCASTTPTSAWSPCARRGDAELRPRVDETLAKHDDDGFVREVRLLQRRVLKRFDNTARSFFALADAADSCFAGMLLELALAADRFYMLIDGDEKVGVATSSRTPASCRCANGLSRLDARFYGEPDARRRSVLARGAEGLDPERGGRRSSASRRSPPTTSTWTTSSASPSRSAPSLSPDALTGMEASLRFVGPETMETKIFGRLSRLAELDLHAPQRDRRARRAHALRQAGAPAVPDGSGPRRHVDRRQRREDPEQRQPLGRQAPAARARGVAAELPRLVEGDGPERLPGATTSTCAPRSPSRPTAGRTSTT